MSAGSIQPENACVIVLGDIGRSPRMQYHVKSLAETGHNVDFVGYLETLPLDAVRSDPRVQIHALNPFPEMGLPNTLKYLFKTIWQSLSLLTTLITIRKPKFILCQNPPAIPAILVAYFYCLLVGARLIIDWHNYTHSILALDSPGSLVARIAKKVEAFVGVRAASNLCVTKAMKQDLEANWNIRATVLYDRPPQQFQPIGLDEKHKLFIKLAANGIKEFNPSHSNVNDKNVEEQTAFTVKHGNGEIKYRDNRPGLLVSSTSWTPDEDFGVLLNALDAYENIATAEPAHYPSIVCVITGKGPLKEHYRQLVANKQWEKVSVVMPWLENEDYPKLLASSDLGVCLHYSSSGLDLPMKVVDMFGTGLPVCAIDFNCIDELVKHGLNGFVFKSSQELADQICNWFLDFPSNIALDIVRKDMERHLRDFQRLRWSENWKNVALAVFKQ